MINRTKKEPGIAYGFFRCDASKEAIEAELPMVRRDTRTPGELELSLTEGMDHLEALRTLLHDPGLANIAYEAKEEGMKYVMQATYPGATNEKASEEIQAILINLSNSLFCRRENEEIAAKIVYKDNGRYVFRD